MSRRSAVATADSWSRLAARVAVAEREFVATMRDEPDVPLPERVLASSVAKLVSTVQRRDPLPSATDWDREAIKIEASLCSIDAQRLERGGFSVPGLRRALQLLVKMVKAGADIGPVVELLSEYAAGLDAEATVIERRRSMRTSMAAGR